MDISRTTNLKVVNFSNRPGVIIASREEDWMWFRGDTVEVLKGPDKGKFGIINMIVQVGNSFTVIGGVLICISNSFRSETG